MMTFDFERHKLNKKREKTLLDEVLGWIFAITIALILAFLLRGFVFESVIVDGPSMENTLQNSDRLILNKIGLNSREFIRGDIVVIEVEPVEYRFLSFLSDTNFARRFLTFSHGKDYIKRIIAVEGDTIDIMDGYVYLNGTKQTELYLDENGVTAEKSFGLPYTVSKDEVFVMGDNRLNSEDSRELGPIETEKILGVARFRIWPLNKIGNVDRNISDVSE